MKETKKLPRILVVDDAPENLMVMESVLSKDYSLNMFDDSGKALEYAFANPPDLILLDVMMPELDGIGTCRRIKQDEKTRHIPVVMVTTKGEPEMVQKAIDAGCNDFITKPLDKTELLSKVRAHLGI